jgi:hypothetical protein
MEGIEPDVRRADEFIEGVEALLSRSPTSGMQSRPDSDIWCISNSLATGMIPVIVFYTFDDDYVTLLSIRKTESPKGRD